MTVIVYLIPVSILLGLVGLGAFLWNLRSGQYDDLHGAAERVLMDEEDRPLPQKQDSLPPDDSAAPGYGSGQ